MILNNNKTMRELACKLGFHSYEIYKEELLTDVRGNIIGKVIINRCKHCGKIQTNKIHNVENY